MTHPRVASRYAKSVLDLAIEKGELEKVYADMQYLRSVMKASREFTNLLRSPVVKADMKKKAFDAVTAGKISPMTNSFLGLLMQKTREGILPEVITSFVEQYKKHKKIQTVKLTTATPVSDSLKKMILDRVKTTGHYENVELVEEVNPDIIGGFVLQAGDKLIDASIAYDLKEIGKQFDRNDFIYRVR